MDILRKIERPGKSTSCLPQQLRQREMVRLAVNTHVLPLHSSAQDDKRPNCWCFESPNQLNNVFVRQKHLGNNTIETWQGEMERMAVFCSSQYVNMCELSQDDLKSFHREEFGLVEDFNGGHFLHIFCTASS